ncbi:hypothetical protein LRR80_04510 [Streptomyces sp. RO-S4]|nr:hypothetical protein [Streptomyces sp. RO-S4]
MRPTDVPGGAGAVGGTGEAVAGGVEAGGAEVGVVATGGVVADGVVADGGGPVPVVRSGGGAAPGRAGAGAAGVGGDDEWCLAGMTAPVRVNEGGRKTVGRWVLRGHSGVYPQEPSHTVRVGNPALC